MPHPRQAPSKGARVVVALSGGVDSATAALLLKNQGYRVSGLLARCWDVNWEQQHTQAKPHQEQPAGQSISRPCMSYEDDYQDVAYTCSLLDIPFHTVDLTEQYRHEVFEDLLQGMKRGITPNPDILCNRFIKFHHLCRYAFSLGADYFATGHYCNTDGHSLFKGEDSGKDQSYFLYAIDPKVLPRVLFPLGHLHKATVRKLAHKAGLSVHNKKDSTGLCFVGKRSFQDFLAGFLGEKTGEFHNLKGEVVGEHRGAHLYTLGQRRHLGLGGAGRRWFVVSKSMQRNIVYVTRGDHPEMHHHRATLQQLQWWGDRPQWGEMCRVKVRYRSPEVEVRLERHADADKVQLHFSQPQRSLTPGQSVVFYQGNRCHGGGILL